jgi:hypothetical protein
VWDLRLLGFSSSFDFVFKDLKNIKKDVGVIMVERYVVNVDFLVWFLTMVAMFHD